MVTDLTLVYVFQEAVIEPLKGKVKGDLEAEVTCKSSEKNVECFFM